MAATFTGGVNWGTSTTATLTASLLVTYIEGTRITNINPVAEFASGVQAFFIGPAEPLSPSVGQRWRDTNNRLVRIYDGSRFQGESEAILLFNTGVTVPLGTVMSFGATSMSISKTMTSRFGGVVGISMELIAQNARGLVRTAGIGSCLVTGTCTAGDLLLALAAGSPPVGGSLASINDLLGYSSTLNREGTGVAYALFNNGGAAGTVTCVVLR